MEQRDWPERLAATIAGEIRRYRLNLKMSAQQLSDRCAELGMEIPRAVISNLENGRRTSVTVAEVLVLAAALGVPPAALIFPVGYAEKTEALPGAEVPPFEAVRWLGGEEFATTPGTQTDAAGPFAFMKWPTDRTPGEAVHVYRHIDREAQDGQKHADRASHMRHDAYDMDEGPTRDGLLQAAESADAATRMALGNLRHTLEDLDDQGILPPDSVNLRLFLHSTQRISPQESE
ncbi:helix-turn-helix domain-containing protein [Streptomyces yunnanensis]|uniref:Helix-turn-helix n=1 Tax=Streptomyces yunnanensis TaxID=156453 RepID=A0A9X8QW14_9ACTN|nr:helix-turn-helix transcriptional regulator [Streptomyces yunnanensis]SHM56992.1 Helix-turn-helix [Streptomyces yunnanensis]